MCKIAKMACLDFVVYIMYSQKPGQVDSISQLRCCWGWGQSSLWKHLHEMGAAVLADQQGIWCNWGNSSFTEELNNIFQVTASM